MNGNHYQSDQHVFSSFKLNCTHNCRNFQKFNLIISRNSSKFYSHIVRNFMISHMVKYDLNLVPDHISLGYCTCCKIGGGKIKTFLHFNYFFILLHFRGTRLLISINISCANCYLVLLVVQLNFEDLGSGFCFMLSPTQILNVCVRLAYLWTSYLLYFST